MMNQKEAATSFLKSVAAGKIREAYERFIAPDFIHHNQYFKGDRQSLMLAMEEASKMNPNKVFEIKKIYEDGSTVVTHSHIRQKPEELGAAVVHIFRFSGDKVVELWDLGQALQKDSPNQYGPF